MIFLLNQKPDTSLAQKSGHFYLLTTLLFPGCDGRLVRAIHPSAIVALPGSAFQRGVIVVQTIEYLTVLQSLSCTVGLQPHFHRIFTAQRTCSSSLAIPWARPVGPDRRGASDAQDRRSRISIVFKWLPVNLDYSRNILRRRRDRVSIGLEVAKRCVTYGDGSVGLYGWRRCGG